MRALRAAALALPGLAVAKGAIADELQYTFDYQRYTEGERNLWGRPYFDLNLKPIEVDSFGFTVEGDLVDRLSFGFDYTQDTWSGATPVATLPQAAIAEMVYSGASTPSYYYADADHHPVIANWDTFDGQHVDYARDSRLAHIMGSASPETRRQFAAHLSYDFHDGAVSFGGGASEEPDYHSLFANLGGRFDFNNAQTTLAWGLSYTNSDIDASLESNTAADWGAYPKNIRYENGTPMFRAARRDYALSLGVTQVIDQDSLVSAGISFTRSAGYLSNPYKAVILAFDDPDQFIDSTGLRLVQVKGTLEQRPDERDQWAISARYVRYVEPLDASVHASYRYYTDDWGIDAHTLELSWYQPVYDGWMVVPSARYYTQSAASFYGPYFVFNQAFPYKLPRNPELPPELDHSQITLKHFASDERLSAFGELGGSFAVSKQLTDAIKIEAGFEYARHAGSLRWIGHGEQSYADFDYHTLYAQLTLNPQQRASGVTDLDLGSNQDGRTPAGVDHETPLAAGRWAVAYRYDYDVRGGGFLHGSDSIRANRVNNRACIRRDTCQLLTTDIDLYAHTLDLLYAPFDWLTLEIQPRVVDSHVDQRFTGSIFHPPAVPPFGFAPPESNTHSAGGIGDTTLAVLVPLLDEDGNRIDAKVGINAPTGSVDVRRSGSHQYLDFAQQLGSGTWDFTPALTYSGSISPMFWGAQGSAVIRLQDINDSGYGLGDEYRASLWVGCEWFDWLSTTVRGAYTWEGGISGMFRDHKEPSVIGYRVVGTEHIPIYYNFITPQSIFAPPESPLNYGGEYWDLGFGLSAVVPDGAFKGNRFSFEWVEPVSQNVNGFQLARTGELAFAWSIAM